MATLGHIISDSALGKYLGYSFGSLAFWRATWEKAGLEGNSNIE